LQVFYDLMRLVRDNKDRAAAAAAGGKKVTSATNGREPRRKRRCTILWRLLAEHRSSFWNSFRDFILLRFLSRQQCLLLSVSRSMCGFILVGHVCYFIHFIKSLSLVRWCYIGVPVCDSVFSFAGLLKCSCWWTFVKFRGIWPWLEMWQSSNIDWNAVDKLCHVWNPSNSTDDIISIWNLLVWVLQYCKQSYCNIGLRMWLNLITNSDQTDFHCRMQGCGLRLETHERLGLVSTKIYNISVSGGWCLGLGYLRLVPKTLFCPKEFMLEVDSML